MAVGTAAALVGGAGALMSGYQAITGAKEKRRAQRELNNYERQELDNAFAEMPISMEGIDYMSDANAGTTAAMADAARNGGTRGIIGAVPKIVGASNAMNANIARYLDEQYNRRNQLIAGDNARIEGIRENRDNMNISALSSQVQAGNQNFWDGMMGFGSSLAYLGRSATPSPRGEVSAANLNTVGITPPSPIPITAAPVTSETDILPYLDFSNFRY